MADTLCGVVDELGKFAIGGKWLKEGYDHGVYLTLDVYQYYPHGGSDQVGFYNAKVSQANTALFILHGYKAGSDDDILGFMPCGDETEQIKKSVGDTPCPLPLYSNLHMNQQTKVFNPVGEGNRKCVATTNVVKTSIAINDIVYVISSGIAQMGQWNVRLLSAL
ncbi:Adenosinetriphosphatase/Nucleoside-triphosphate phosphatase [Xylaria longipes]|nr:Adenosinetriphosphatase/Nucleoside-triphosphate phosphatase [Xylaria longipes]